MLFADWGTRINRWQCIVYETTRRLLHLASTLRRYPFEKDACEHYGLGKNITHGLDEPAANAALEGVIPECSKLRSSANSFSRLFKRKGELPCRVHFPRDGTVDPKQVHRDQ
jgi:hypothetical protein